MYASGAMQPSQHWPSGKRIRKQPRRRACVCRRQCDCSGFILSAGVILSHAAKIYVVLLDRPATSLTISRLTTPCYSATVPSKTEKPVPSLLVPLPFPCSKAACWSQECILFSMPEADPTKATICISWDQSSGHRRKRFKTTSDFIYFGRPVQRGNSPGDGKALSPLRHIRYAFLLTWFRRRWNLSVVPGCEPAYVVTIRDAQKWPEARQAQGAGLQLDPINYNLLSPYTISKMRRPWKCSKTSRPSGWDFRDLLLPEHPHQRVLITKRTRAIRKGNQQVSGKLAYQTSGRDCLLQHRRFGRIRTHRIQGKGESSICRRLPLRK